jgi:hypothetical protein
VLPGHEAEIRRRAPGTVPQFRDPSVNWQVGWKVLSLAGGRRRRMLDG